MASETISTGESSLDIAVHDSLTPWIANHCQRSSGEITDLGYNPRKYPFQKLSESYTPAKDYPAWVPERLILFGIERALAKNLGSRQKAHAMIDVFLETPGWESSSVSIAEGVRQRIDNQETVGIVSDHMENGDLRDIALVMGGLIRAIGDSDLRYKSAILMGKNISRQAYQKRAVAKLAAKGTGIVWVMQDTKNRKRLGVPEPGVKSVNRGAFRTLRELRKGGLMLGIVPSGTAMKRIEPTPGKKVYVRPEVMPVTTKLMDRLDSLLPVGIYQGLVLAGPLTRTGSESALADLAQHDANLTGWPVSYQDASGQPYLASPGRNQL